VSEPSRLLGAASQAPLLIGGNLFNYRLAGITLNASQILSAAHRAARLFRAVSSLRKNSASRHAPSSNFFPCEQLVVTRVPPSKSGMPPSRRSSSTCKGPRDRKRCVGNNCDFHIDGRILSFVDNTALNISGIRREHDVQTAHRIEPARQRLRKHFEPSEPKRLTYVFVERWLRARGNLPATGFPYGPCRCRPARKL
jgi:hypothetical protein